jgi:hypothetical protein
MTEYTENYPPLPSHEDGISNRERRSLRGPSVQARRTAAREAQTASGLRVRVSRAVKNQLAFKDELKVWHLPVQTGIATRKSLGSLAVTIFDTAQQPLRFGEMFSEAALKDVLDERYPALFEESPPIEVTGTDLFGSRQSPFVALTLAAGFAYREQASVQAIIAPELSLDASHQLEHRPHVSLGRLLVADRAQDIRAQLAPLIPEYVQFKPATICIETQ